MHIVICRWINSNPTVGQRELYSISCDKSQMKRIFVYMYVCVWASQVALVVKILPANAGDTRDASLITGQGRRFPWSRKCHPTPVSLSGIFQGQRSLMGYSPWGRKESDTTQRLNQPIYIFGWIDRQCRAITPVTLGILLICHRVSEIDLPQVVSVSSYIFVY